jgi:hypothetical protein
MTPFPVYPHLHHFVRDFQKSLLQKLEFATRAAQQGIAALLLRILGRWCTPAA